jgi:hypothetical protein
MAARRERYSPTGPFVDGSGGDGTSNIYSVEEDGTVDTSEGSPLLVLDWQVPVGASGVFAIHWSVEASAPVDTALEPAICGTVTLEANAVEVVECYLLKGGANDPQPWFQFGGVVVRELAAGQSVEMFIAALTEGNMFARRRRFAIYPVTVLS